MKLGRKQSKNVERGKKLDAADQSNVDFWGHIPNNEGKPYMGLAKKQLQDQNAFARGRRMGMEAQHKAIETGKLGKNTADVVKKSRHGKHSRNPFSK